MLGPPRTLNDSPTANQDSPISDPEGSLLSLFQVSVRGAPTACQAPLPRCLAYIRDADKNPAFAELPFYWDLLAWKGGHPFSSVSQSCPALCAGAHRSTSLARAKRWTFPGGREGEGSLQDSKIPSATVHTDTASAHDPTPPHGLGPGRTAFTGHLARSLYPDKPYLLHRTYSEPRCQGPCPFQTWSPSPKRHLVGI